MRMQIAIPPWSNPNLTAPTYIQLAIYSADNSYPSVNVHPNQDTVVR
jgi:hypothetical protein